MDVFGIIYTDGYKYENLTEENQSHIKWLKFLIEDIGDRKCEYTDTAHSTLLERVRNEIARDAIDDVVEYARTRLAEYQISMIENQEDVEDADV